MGYLILKSTIIKLNRFSSQGRGRGVVPEGAVVRARGRAGSSAVNGSTHHSQQARIASPAFAAFCTRAMRASLARALPPLLACRAA